MFLVMECSICGLTFSRMDNYNRHIEGHSKEKNFRCSKCSKAFTRKDAQQRHVKNCKRVNEQQPSGSGIRQPKRLRTETRQQTDFTIRKVKTAFRNATVK